MQWYTDWRKVETFRQWVEKSSVFSQVQGLGSFKSTLTRLCATHPSPSLPRQNKPRALGVTYSVPPSHVEDDVPTVAMSWINFLGFIVGMSWDDLALLFKKGVGREVAVLEVADTFSSVQHPSFADAKYTAGDVSQSAFYWYVQNSSWRLRLCSLVANATLTTTLRFSMAKATVVSRSFSATCSPVWLPRKITSPCKRIKSSGPPQQSSHPWQQKLVEASDARASGRAKYRYPLALQLFLS